MTRRFGAHSPARNSQSDDEQHVEDVTQQWLAAMLSSPERAGEVAGTQSNVPKQRRLPKAPARTDGRK
jgi:hypothetical protein